MKKLNLILLTLLILLGLSPLKAEAAAKKITVKCDGQIISTEKLYGIEKKGNVMIPFTILTKSPEVTKVYGQWKSSKNKLLIDRNNISLELSKGKKLLVKNNEFRYQLPEKVYAYTMEGVKRMMIPSKKVCQLLGFKYYYNKANGILYLASKKAPAKYTGQMNSKPFLLMDTEEFVAAIGPIARAEYKKRGGMLPSVTIAQAINESLSGVSYLAQKGNNLFGMKTYLSGNKWKGTSWKGKRVVKRTKEQYGKRVVTITAAFRKYDNVAQSFRDHSAYFKNAKNEYGKYRYKGIGKTKSCNKQISIIMKGGYCTFRNYGTTLKGLIKKYNLTRFDK